VFTVDFRYYDGDLNPGDCNAFTSGQSRGHNPINPGGFGSIWCTPAFGGAGKIEPTASANLKYANEVALRLQLLGCAPS
jgi:hypothetical protein